MSNEAIDTEVVSQALAVREPTTTPALFGTTEPIQIIEKATAVASALKNVIGKQGLISKISNKEYPRCEAWTLLGTMLGVFPVLAWSRPIEGGWEARVEAKTRDGSIVGAAEAQCLRAEQNWKNRDDFAIRSMAQTRATAKALRMPLGFVMTLAGYEPTPAEEMIGTEPTTTTPVANPRPQTPKPPPRQAAPTKTPGNAQSAPNPPDPEKCKARLLQAVSAKHWEVFAWEWMVKEGWLLNTEPLRDFPVHKAPLTKEAFEMLMGIFEQGLRKAVLAGGVTQKLQEEFDAAHADPFSDNPPLSVVDAIVDGVKDDVYDASNPEPSAEDDRWRQFPMPFGKHAGVALEDLEKNYLFGLWANYKVETEFKGKPKKPETIKRDEEFRAMLDLAGEHYQFKLPQ